MASAADVQTAIQTLHAGRAVVVPLSLRDSIEQKLLRGSGSRETSLEWPNVAGVVATAYRVDHGMLDARLVIEHTDIPLSAEQRSQELQDASQRVMVTAATQGVTPKGVGTTDAGTWSKVDSKGTLTYNYSKVLAGDINPTLLATVERQWVFWINTAQASTDTTDLWLVEDNISGSGKGAFDLISLSNGNWATGQSQLKGWSPEGKGGGNNCTTITYAGFSYQLCTSGYHYYAHNDGIGADHKVWWNLDSSWWAPCNPWMPSPSTFHPVTTFLTPRGSSLTMGWDHTITVGLALDCHSTNKYGYDSGTWSIPHP